MSTAPTADRSDPSRLRVAEGGIPWRRTFLRRHLTQELREIAEILVLGDLRRQGLSVSPLDFFFPMPDKRARSTGIGRPDSIPFTDRAAS